MVSVLLFSPKLLIQAPRAQPLRKGLGSHPGAWMGERGVPSTRLSRSGLTWQKCMESLIADPFLHIKSNITFILKFSFLLPGVQANN